MTNGSTHSGAPKIPVDLRVVCVIVGGLALFAPFLVDIEPVSGRVTIMAMTYTYYVPYGFSDLNWYLLIIAPLVLTVWRIVFVYQMVRYYQGKSSRRLTVLLGVLAELLILPYYQSIPLPITRWDPGLTVPTPLMLFAAMVFMWFAPHSIENGEAFVEHPFEATSIRNRFRFITLSEVNVLVVIAVVLASGFLFSRPTGNGSFDGTITHQLDIWIEPKDYEFDLHVSFYETRFDAEDSANRLIGAGETINPNTEHRTMYLYDIPLSLNGVWVSIYCSYDTEIVTDTVIDELTLSASKVFIVDDFEMTLRLTLF